MGTKIWGSQTAGDSAKSFWLDPSSNSLMKGDTPVFAATENGYIDAVYVYASTQNGSAATAKNAIYVGDTLEKETPLYTLSGTMGWQGQIFGSNGYLYVVSGSQLVGAVWTNTNGLEIYAVNNGGTFDYNQSSGQNDFPNPWSGVTKTSWGGLGWYCTYFPVATATVGSGSVTVGSQFTITGQSFSAGVTAITVNGVNAPTYTVNSDTSITCTVPTGATTGPVVVHTNAGTATSNNLNIGSTVIGYVRRSGLWSAASGIYVRRSGAWSAASEIDVRRSNAWTHGT